MSYVDTNHVNVPYSSKVMRKHIHKARRRLIQFAKDNGVTQPWDMYLVAPWWVMQWAGAIPNDFPVYNLFKAEKEGRLPEVLMGMDESVGNYLSLVCEHDREFSVTWDLTNPPEKLEGFTVCGILRGPVYARRGRRRAVR